MTAPPRPAATSGRIPLWIKILMGVLVIVVVFLILTGITLVFGRVQGTEFSPQTFNQRTFYFWKLPLVGLKVSSIHRDDTTGPLEKHLIGNKMIPAFTGVTQWDLVTLQTGNGAAQINDPQILIDYLAMSDAGGYCVWQRWSEDHPEYAQLFWPVIARLARGNLYVHLPEFFRLARGANDATKFATDLTAAEVQLHRKLGERCERQGDIVVAHAHFNAAIKLAPMDLELQQKCTTLESRLPKQANKN